MVARAPGPDAADGPKGTMRGALSEQKHAVMGWFRVHENHVVAKPYGLERFLNWGLRTGSGTVVAGLR